MTAPRTEDDDDGAIVGDIVVTGITGYLGGAIAKVSRSPLRCIVRAGSVRGDRRWPRITESAAAGAFRVVGDVTLPTCGIVDPLSTEGLEHARAVLHLAADTSWSDPHEVLWTANVTGTIQAYRLASSLGVPFVQVSSSYAAFRTQGTVAAGPADPQPWLAKYEESKRAAEDALVALVREGGPPVRIIRVPGLGADATASRSAGTAFAAMVRLAPVPVLPFARCGRVDVVPRDRVAAAIMRLVDAPFEAGVEFHQIGLGDQAPFVEGVLLEAAALMSAAGERPKRCIAVSSNRIMSLSGLGDRSPAGNWSTMLIGLRYLACGAVFEPTVALQPQSSREFLATLGFVTPDAVAYDDYFAGWTS